MDFERACKLSSLLEEYIAREYPHVPDCNEPLDEVVARMSSEDKREVEQYVDLSVSIPDIEYVAHIYNPVHRNFPGRSHSTIYTSVLVSLMQALEKWDSVSELTVDVACGYMILPRFMLSEGLIRGRLVGTEASSVYPRADDIIKCWPWDIKVLTGMADLAMSVDLISLCIKWRDVVAEMARITREDGLVFLAWTIDDHRVDISQLQMLEQVCKCGLDPILAVEDALVYPAGRNVVAAVRRKPKGIIAV